MFVKLLISFFFVLGQDIKSMTMLCPDHLEDAGRLGKDYIVTLLFLEECVQ